ncbi:tetratricopeptide repeat protein [bacterium]|nr:tetratricopeptide repeat protein [bacterium]
MHIGLRHSYYRAMFSSAIGIMVLTAYVTTRSELIPVIQAPFDLMVLSFSIVTVVGGLIERSLCIRLNEDIKESKHTQARFQLIKKGAVNPRYYARFIEPGGFEVNGVKLETMELNPRNVMRKLFDGRVVDAEVVIDKTKDFPIAIHLEENFIFARLNAMRATPLPMVSDKTILKKRLSTIAICLAALCGVLVIFMQDLSFLGTRLKLESTALSVHDRDAAVNKLIDSGNKFARSDPRRLTSKVTGARYLAESGRFDGALNELAKARNDCGALPDPELWRAYILLNLGQVLIEAGRVDAAETHLIEALEILKPRGKTSLLAPVAGWWCYTVDNIDSIKAEALLALAMAHDITGDTELAEQRYISLINHENRNNQIRAEETTRLRLASYYFRRNQPQKAEAELDRVLELAAQESPNQPLANAARLVELGIWSFNRNELASAEQLLKKALVLYDQEKPLSEFSLATNLNFLGETLKLQGKLDEAEAIFKRSLKILEKDRTGGEWTWPALSLEDIKMSRGDYEASQERIQEIYKERCRIFGKESLRTACPKQSLGNYFRNGKDYDKACENLKECLDKRRSILGIHHPQVLSVLKDLAESCADKGDLEKAGKLRQELEIDSRRPVF